MNEVFSERLKTARLRAGLKAKELAKICGISASYLSELESGKRAHPANLLVDKFASECNVTVNWLLGRPDSPLSALVREAPVAYGQAGQCRYPADCDLPGQIAELREDYAAMQATLSKMAGQLKTVTGLLGNALAPGLGIAHSDAHRKQQPRKAG